MKLFLALVAAAALPPTILAVSWTLGPARSVAVPPAVSGTAFPASAFARMTDAGATLAFWSSAGVTWRTEAPNEPFPTKTNPATPVLGPGVARYDSSGSFILAVEADVGGGLVGFTRSESRNWTCSDCNISWTSGAIVRSTDAGVTWRTDGLAIWNEPPSCCPSNPDLVGARFDSVVRNRTAGEGAGFLAYGGCSAFRSLDPTGAPSSWMRWFDGHFGSGFTEPGIDGMSSCLPYPFRYDAVRPVVHYNDYLSRYVMVHGVTAAAEAGSLYITTSTDGTAWEASELLLSPEAPYTALSWGQVVGPDGDASSQAATLIYAAAADGSSADFIARAITFTQ